MTEQEKYAEIYRDPPSVTAADRAAFGAIWRGIWGDDLAYELAPTNSPTGNEIREAEWGVAHAQHSVQVFAVCERAA